MTTFKVNFYNCNTPNIIELKGAISELLGLEWSTDCSGTVSVPTENTAKFKSALFAMDATFANVEAIIEVNDQWFRGELIAKWFVFADDTQIAIGSDDMTVTDMDGMMTAPESKLAAIEARMNISINR